MAARDRFVPLTQRREDALLSAIAFADRAVRTVDRELVDLPYVRRQLLLALRAVEGSPSTLVDAIEAIPGDPQAAARGFGDLVRRHAVLQAIADGGRRS